MRLILVLSTIFAAAFAASASAQDERVCMAEVAITPAIVQAAGQSDWGAYGSEGASPAFVSGYLSPTRDAEDAETVSGSIVFVRAGGGWRAFLPSPGEGIVGVYAAPASGAMIIATMWGSEGPGSSWTLLRSSNALASGACTIVAFPESLNQPLWANEYLDLADLDISPRGRGEIVAVARRENESELHYLYETRDGGVSWNKPRAIRQNRPARGGAYVAVEATQPPDALVVELTAYAASR